MHVVTSGPCLAPICAHYHHRWQGTVINAQETHEMVLWHQICRQCHLNSVDNKEWCHQVAKTLAGRVLRLPTWLQPVMQAQPQLCQQTSLWASLTPCTRQSHQSLFFSNHRMTHNPSKEVMGKFNTNISSLGSACICLVASFRKLWRLCHVTDCATKCLR